MIVLRNCAKLSEPDAGWISSGGNVKVLPGKKSYCQIISSMPKTHTLIGIGKKQNSTVLTKKKKQIRTSIRFRRRSGNACRCTCCVATLSSLERSAFILATSRNHQLQQLQQQHPHRWSSVETPLSFLHPRLLQSFHVTHEAGEAEASGHIVCGPPGAKKISREKICSLVKFLPSGVSIRPAVLPQYSLRD